MKAIADGLKRSVCPFDCPSTCGLLVEVADGKAVKITGDSTHPYSRGTLCAKMRNYQKAIHSKDRLTVPLIRTGEKGSGKFSPISWEEAVFQIKSRWENLTRKYGAEAILPYSYAGTMGVVQRNIGTAFFHKLGASRLERTICSSAKGYGFKCVMGNSPMPNPIEIAESDFIILWGINAAATSIHTLNYIREARKKNNKTKVWLIETYHSPTAAVADKTILVRPGSDGAFALGLMHILEQKGLVDEKFIEKYVQGYDKLKTEILPQYPPDVVSKITGCPKEDLEELALLYAQASRPIISLGSGLSRYGNGAMSTRTISCLPAVIGAWAKPASGLIRGLATEEALPVAPVERADFLSKPTRIINMNQLGSALNETTSPPIMSIYVYNSNPAIISPNQNAVLKGLSRNDLFTVVHERFMTETALYADIVLPATTFLEHSDIYRSYGHYCTQRSFPAIEPLGEAKSNWDVFRLLAEALGFEEPFFKQTTDEIIEQMLAHPSRWLAKTDINALRNGLPVELPVEPLYMTNNYLTPSGKIEIYNPAEPEPLPRYIEPHSQSREVGTPFWLVNAPSVYSLNSSFGECDELAKKRGQMTLMMNPADAVLKNFACGEKVTAFNEMGEATFFLKVTPKTPPGVVVTEGVFWLKHAPGNTSVNALTSELLTDRANGSTFYDTKVDVKKQVGN